MIVRDIFGVQLYEGDIVVYADSRVGEDAIGLDLYEIHAIDDGVVSGVLCSGEYMGNVFYLEDTSTRCCLVRNAYKSAELKFVTPMH